VTVTDTSHVYLESNPMLPWESKVQLGSRRMTIAMQRKAAVLAAEK
jgi:hypothetical protein